MQKGTPTKKTSKKTIKNNTKEITKRGWGLESGNIDESIRPQDDFYHYTNGTWLKNNPIPDTESRWGGFAILRFETEKQLRKILIELDEKKKVEVGTPEQMIRDFYRSGMDEKKRKSLGLVPLDAQRKKISSLKSSKDVLKFITDMHAKGDDYVWGAGVDQDAKKSDTYILYIGQGGLGLPDRDYYLKDDTESKRVREAYVKHVQKMFMLMGKPLKEAQEGVEAVMDIETRLAKASMKKEDMRDLENMYHKKTVKQLEKHTPKLEWSSYLKKLGAGKSSEVILMQPDFFAEVQTMIDEVSVEAWKNYFEWHLISGYSGYLSPEFVRESFYFYGKVLAGRTKMRPLWRQILGAVNGGLGELLGQIYVSKHFSPEAKAQVNEIVDDLLTAYEARIKNLDWMSSATKKKALKKLSQMQRKLGYPDSWKSYKGLDIKADDFVGNATRLSQFEHKREMKKLGKPIDRTEWFMTPQTVNAYYSPIMNEMVFPSAILQYPFFNAECDAALNYGGIGLTIGHEITHGFDDEGSKFDGYGNMKSWWTAEDKAKFEKKTKVLENQFNLYEVDDGLKVNGKLTLGENIADLGGLLIAFDAYQLYLARHGRKDIDGLTPEQRFFLAYAQEERENSKPEFTKMQVLTDPHSPAKFRVNGPFSNLPEFYKAFGVKKGDKLYRSPATIAKIW
jgi:putative endopeptidase